MCLCNSLNIKQYVGDILNKNTTKLQPKIRLDVGKILSIVGPGPMVE